MIEFFVNLRKDTAAGACCAAGRGLAVAAIALAGILGAGTARAATETPIYDFTGGKDGGAPQGGVIRDQAAETAGIVPAGTLFGTSAIGGKYDGGTLFMLTPPRPASGAAWTLTVLHPFDVRSGSTDGNSPLGDLIADAAGNLFGTTVYGGDKVCAADPHDGCGTVFELSTPATAGEKWTYRVLHRFRIAAYPEGKLTFNPSGNGVLYGTTNGCGDPTCDCGVVFSLTPPGVDGNTASGWAVSWLRAFRGGIYGSTLDGSLVFDNSSPPHLFGVAKFGGASNDGVVFELLPPNSAGNPLSHWSEKLIHSFKGEPTDGAFPDAGLIVDGKGVLYGTTQNGGSHSGTSGIGSGTAFEILPPSLSTTRIWEEVVLHNFRALSQAPDVSLLLDPATGELYGTTLLGSQGGSVFELAPTGNPKVWTETVLLSFMEPPTDGENPIADLNFGTDANYLYGTTEFGGLHGLGTVYEVTLP